MNLAGPKTSALIDRITTFKADTAAVFKDAKDGMLGLRLAHELQIPATEDQKFTDNKGNVTIVKAGTDMVANGNYLTSAGKTGNDAGVPGGYGAKCSVKWAPTP